MRKTRVYNNGSRPIVYQSNFRGTLAIHPRKYIETDEDHAQQIIGTYEHAVDEKTFAGAPRRGRPPKMAEPEDDA